ncbi:SecDF P1 head subdomain-containing protein [Actinokineospora globicatena]|nr:hypothetical protein [Actinokineospora globicatena]MCP2304651.1 preprotein translocase subunit SecD [Actinokineospora globicatena]
MRKPIIHALVVAALLAVAACGSDAASTPTGSPGPGASASESAPVSSAGNPAGSGLVTAKVPVELRPVVSVKPGMEVSGPDQVIGPDDTVYTLGPSIGQFPEFKSVRAERTDFGWVVTIELTAATSAVFAQWTTAHVGEQLAVMVDGTMVSAPTIQAPITGGSVQISGNFTEESAKRLVAEITGS